MSAVKQPFACRCCGACCQAPGEVWLEADEAVSIASFMGLSADAFIAGFTRLARNRQALALTERADGGCVFLDPRNRCRIQPVKPKQCRDYPHRWRSPLLDATCPAARDEKKAK